MYRKIEPAIRMTANEASSRYPDEFVIMYMGRPSLTDDVGDVLYVGDNREELYPLLTSLNLNYSGIVTGLNHYRNCLGGVVVERN